MHLAFLPVSLRPCSQLSSRFSSVSSFWWYFSCSSAAPSLSARCSAVVAISACKFSSSFRSCVTCAAICVLSAVVLSSCFFVSSKVWIFCSRFFFHPAVFRRPDPARPAFLPLRLPWPLSPLFLLFFYKERFPLLCLPFPL